MIPDKEIAESCLVFIDRHDDDTCGTGFSGKDLFDLSNFKTDETNVSAWPEYNTVRWAACVVYTGIPKDSYPNVFPKN